MKYNNESIKMYSVILILILSIVAVSTNYWSTSKGTIDDKQGDIAKYSVNAGLWKACTSISTSIKGIPGPGNKNQCMDTSTPGPNGLNLKNLNTVKILSISSLVLFALSLYLLYAMPKQKEYFVLCLVLAGILSIASVIAWNNDPSLKDQGNKLKQGYSWYLELSSGLLAVLLAGLTQFNVIA